MIATDTDKRKMIVSLLELYPASAPEQTLDSRANDALETGLADGVISRAEGITLFSIPAHATIAGTYTSGYVSIGDQFDVPAFEGEFVYKTRQ
jgi:hypothetical protein